MRIESLLSAAAIAGVAGSLSSVGAAPVAAGGASASLPTIHCQTADNLTLNTASFRAGGGCPGNDGQVRSPQLAVGNCADMRMDWRVPGGPVAYNPGDITRSVCESDFIYLQIQAHTQIDNYKKVAAFASGNVDARA